MYNITQYTKNQAKELKVKVKPSSNKNKKIDVFKDGKKIASVGSIGYLDYPSYIKNSSEYQENRDAYPFLPCCGLTESKSSLEKVRAKAGQKTLVQRKLISNKPIDIGQRGTIDTVLKNFIRTWFFGFGNVSTS